MSSNENCLKVAIIPISLMNTEFVTNTEFEFIVTHTHAPPQKKSYLRWFSDVRLNFKPSIPIPHTENKVTKTCKNVCAAYTLNGLIDSNKLGVVRLVSVVGDLKNNMADVYLCDLKR